MWRKPKANEERQEAKAEGEYGQGEEDVSKILELEARLKALEPRKSNLPAVTCGICKLRVIPSGSGKSIKDTYVCGFCLRKASPVEIEMLTNLDYVYDVVVSELVGLPNTRIGAGDLFIPAPEGQRAVSDPAQRFAWISKAALIESFDKKYGQTGMTGKEFPVTTTEKVMYRKAMRSGGGQVIPEQYLDVVTTVWKREPGEMVTRKASGRPLTAQEREDAEIENLQLVLDAQIASKARKKTALEEKVRVSTALLEALQ